MTDEAVAATIETGQPEAAAPAAITGAATEAAPAAAGTETVTGAVATDALRPEGLPDAFWDGAAIKVGDLWNAYRELTAANEARLADVPQAADGYELKVSDEVKVPEGFKVDIDAKDPFFVDITRELHAAGAPRATVQKLVDAYARQQIADQTQATEVYSAEMGKLGENAKARIEAVDNWLTANLTKEEAAALAASKFSAVHVRAFEKIIALRKAAQPGPGGGQTATSLDGLRGGDMLDAIRAKAA